MSTVKGKIKQLLLSPAKVFLILSLVFGTFSAFLVPQLSVTDEQMHFLRSYSLADFHLQSEACQYPQGILEKVAKAEVGEFSTNYRHTVSLDYSASSKDSEASTASPSSNTCGSAASYNPFLHIPQAIGIFIVKLFFASPDLMVLAGRLMNVLFYSVFLYFIIKFARVGKWAIVVVALLPSMVHLAGSVSGDVFNNAIVIGFISVVLSLIVQKTKASKKQLLGLALLALALSFTKLPNILLIGLLLAVPPVVLLPRKIQKLPKFVQYLIPPFVAVIIFGIGLVTWQMMHGNAGVVVAPDNPLDERPWHFLRILFNTYIEPFIGYNNVVLEGVTDFFSSFRYSLPDFVVFISWITLFFTLLVRDSTESLLKKKHLVFTAVLAFGILSGLIVGITYALYTAWAIQPFRLGPGALYADGVQGRYFTAFLCLLIPIFMLCKKYIHVETRSPLVTAGIVVISTVFVLTFYTVQTYFFSITI